MKKLLLILITVILSTTLFGCSMSSSNQNSKTVNDFTSWDKEKLYNFLDDVLTYTREANQKVYTNKEEIITLYNQYFSLELSKKIVDSLFIKTDEGWRVPEGDGGYLFFVPKKEDNNEIDDFIIEFEKEYIRLKATFSMGMFSSVEYVIENHDNPTITTWVIER